MTMAPKYKVKRSFYILNIVPIMQKFLYISEITLTKVTIICHKTNLVHGSLNTKR